MSSSLPMRRVKVEGGNRQAAARGSSLVAGRPQFRDNFPSLCSRFSGRAELRVSFSSGMQGESLDLVAR